MKWSVVDLIKWTTNYFSKHGIKSPRLESEHLLAKTLNVSRLDLYLNFDRPLQEGELGNFKAYIKRRIAHEPLSYILGTQEFFGETFLVDRNVLIPRKETEFLVEKIFDYYPGQPPSLDILEIGTGSGVIAITLAKKLKPRRVVATDVSSTALDLAKENAKKHQVDIEFYQRDLFEGLTGERFDLIVSNPPYVASREKDQLAKEIILFEPWGALDGGEEGLKFIRLISQSVADFLKPKGRVFLEVGDGQAKVVVGFLALEKKFKMEIFKDYSSIERVVLGELIDG